jgi:hypothetical protein
MNYTTGSWSPDDRPCHFLAANLTDQQRLAIMAYKYVLVPVDTIMKQGDESWLEDLFAAGVHVLLDSGIYALAAEHSRRHGMSLPEALGLAPAAVDGFEALWSCFVRLVHRYGDQLWGCVELDLGGADNKRRTRARLEDLGIVPIPVYHPLVDGWDYFDELAAGYDRIGWGNIVDADKALRLRMLMTMEDRRRSYPQLWIHALGLTPSEWANAFTLDSTDSSSWLESIRFGGYHERAMLAVLSTMGRDFRYLLGDSSPDSPTSDKAALAMAGVGVTAGQLGWRHWLAQLGECGITPGSRGAPF